MAPEQIDGSDVSPATDLYAVGVLLYEMLTGKRPFQRSSRAATLRAHLREPPPSQPEDGSIPPALFRVIQRSWNKSPEHRFKDALSFIEALGGSLNDDDTLSTEPMTSQPTCSPWNRNTLRNPSTMMLNLRPPRPPLRPKPRWSRAVESPCRSCSSRQWLSSASPFGLLRSKMVNPVQRTGTPHSTRHQTESHSVRRAALGVHPQAEAVRLQKPHRQETPVQVNQRSPDKM